MRAVERENETVIGLLLENGAVPDFSSRDGQSALSLAKSKGNKTVIELLESYRKSLSRNPTAGASIGEPHALAYTSRTPYVSYA